MGRKRKVIVSKEGRPQYCPKSVAAAWLALTWEHLDDWAGSRAVQRGKSYQRQGRVKNLVIDDEGRLLATVTGSERYVTSASIKPAGKSKHRLESVCTCLVGDRCKHGVAVVADYLALLSDQKQPPKADPDDPRWLKLTGESGDDFDDEDYEGWDEEYPADEEEDPGAPEPRREASRGARNTTRRVTAGRSKRRTRAEWDTLLRSHIESKDGPELVELVWSLIERFPELRQEFQERIELTGGDVDRLVSQARRELRTVTSETAWRNHWNNEGHTPDYSRLKHRLERLVELGHTDAVVELGRELIRRGMEQVGASHDEGETAMELGESLGVVFEAVTKSTLTPPDKILYAIDATLLDDYGVMDSVADRVLDATWSKVEWSVVADALMRRLSRPAAKGNDDFTDKYRRDALSGWVLHALAQAGRKAELLPIYEAEACQTGSYQRLVAFLIEQKRYEDAQRWAREGIEKTRQEYPGIAAGLAASLCDVARLQRRWDVVAAHAACEFFERPSPHGFEQLLAAADKAKCSEKVRAGAMQFLETGRSPLRLRATQKSSTSITVDADWPLPVPDYLAPLTRLDASGHSSSRPHFNVLLDMAIAAKRPEEALQWYDKIGAGKQASRSVGRWDEHSSYADRVAAAVAATHPERALEIYQRALDAYLPRAEFSAYESCAGYLRKMRSIMHAQDRDDYWIELLKDIREKYRNRPRFMEILDKLEGRTIVASRKSSRRR
jgi:uncharacterized Zn finger protein